MSENEHLPSRKTGTTRESTDAPEPSDDWTPADPATGGRTAWNELGRRNELLPPHLFSDEIAAAELYQDWTTYSNNPQKPKPGPESPALAGLVASKCAGWPEVPTGRELYEALRAEAPTPRQQALIRTWWVEATFEQIMEAWLQRAYSIRDLVRAVHAAGCQRTETPYLAERMRTLNFWAAP